ncbi:MAG TPA: DUF3971 domain-containing protein, partial [Nevskiaceae bacterium]|nr:DUF3971 domain-containing protein [Nevskiaceae bacterium]
LDDQRHNIRNARFTLERLDAGNTREGFELDGALRLPSVYGESLRFEAAVRGHIGRPQQWRGGFRLRGDNLLPQMWLRGHVAPGTRVAAENIGLDLQGELAGGALSAVRLTLTSGTLAASRPRQDLQLQSLRAALSATRDAAGWLLRVQQLDIDGETQARGELRYTPSAQGYAVKVEAPLLRLDRIAPWLGFARTLPGWLQHAAGASGEIDDAVLDLRQDGDARHYAARASLRQLQFASSDGLPGVGGISGELSADENGGRFTLGGGGVALDLPATFAAPVQLDQLAGEVSWQQVPEGWQISAPVLDWRLAGGAGRARVGLLLPAGERSPELDLGASFAFPDAVALKGLMPLHWSEGLRSWLDRGIVAARIPSARLAIHGALADFPFVDGKPGEWKLDVSVAGATLAYAARWPQADNLRAQLHFRGNSLSIESDGADLGGVHARRINAEFGDFRESHLAIDGQVSGEMVRYYSFLQNSPLRETLSGLLDNTRAAGPAEVSLHLDIPLRDAQRTAASGLIRLDGVELYYGSLADPVSDIHGELAFDQDGVSGQDLTAAFADTHLSARVERRAGTRGVVVAQFPYTPNAEGSGLSAYVPQRVREVLSGTSSWRAELPLGVSGDGLHLSSDLRGTAISLPAPLGKSADDSAGIAVSVASVQDKLLRVHANDAGRLDADIALLASASGWNTRGVTLNVGPGSAPPAGEGMTITSDAAELDAIEWIAAVRGMLRQPAGEGLALKPVELKPGRITFAGR